MEINTSKASLTIVGLLGFALLPLGLIWSLNTLFLLKIEYSFFTWLSAMFMQFYLQILIKSGTISSKDK
jgi:hypothetical protein